jgi:3-isopropylmalate/(R)-2-methylmalate dehydratase small subunit
MTAADPGGRAFVYGDNIDTDALAPGHAMKLGPAALARHCLESVDPGFAAAVRDRDILVAGRNFGMGSSREQAAQALKQLGIAAVLAASFARIFYRNAINIGLPALVLPAGHGIRTGDRLAVDPLAGLVVNLSQDRRHEVAPLPPHLLAMIRDGGLIPHLRRRLAVGGRP